MGFKHWYLLGCLALFYACQNPLKEEKDPEPVEVRSLGVESLPKEAEGQIPAFEGQTRVRAILTNTSYQLDTVMTGIDRPWGLAFLPDNRIIFTEKPGRIRIISDTGLLGDAIAGLLPVHYQQDGGLMDIALSPEFSTDRALFWSYSEKRDTGYVPAIARARLSEDETTLEDIQVIYRAGPAVGSVMHYGTKLLFDPEGYLLATMGERFEPRVRSRAQVLNSAFGKVIRIDQHGHGAPNNPFNANKDALPEIWAFGFRDPQGLAFHLETGELWLSDHGPRAGDEINLIEPGRNYGWPIISYGLEYSREPVNEGETQADSMEQPLYYWDPAVAPAGICFYSGKLIPEWKNNLFVACLRGKHLIRLTLDGHKITGEERLLEDWGQRIRGVTEGPEGALYVWTDEGEGCIARLVRR